MNGHVESRGLVNLLVTVLAFAGCGEGAAPPDSLVLITLDTTRADALGFYDPEGAPTPNLERLAARGVVFEEASTVAPITLPSHASMLTGLYPPRHGIRDNAHAALPASATTVAELARGRGMQTGAFVASAVLRPEFGLDQGFDVYDAPELPAGAEAHHAAERGGGIVVKRACDWLAGRDPERPFFLWVHLFEPHDPYEPPAPFDETSDHPYLGEVAYVDSLLSPLLGRLGELEERGTAVNYLVVADHGEGLGEHGERTHSFFLYQQVIAVPMILVRADGERAGERSRAVCSVVDVAPTLAAALGLSMHGIDGLSLWDRDPGPERGVYFESYAGHLSFGWSPVSGWRRGSEKYIHGPEPELYDLALDPGETTNRVADAIELRSFRQAIGACGDAPKLIGDVAEFDPELIQGIQSLGYVSSGPVGGALPHPLETDAGPAPHSRARELEEIQLGTSAYQRGEFTTSLRIFERLLVDNPGHPRALYMKANALVALGRNREAIEPLQAALARQRGTPTDHFNLAVSLRGVGRGDEAVASFETALSMSREAPGWFPAFLEILRGRGELERRQRWQEHFAVR